MKSCEAWRQRPDGSAPLLLAIAISAFNIWRKLRKKSRDNH